MKHRVSLIAALAGSTRAIGKENDLLFSVPGDLARFKELTMGHPVIMGRKTWNSLPERFRPLPGRANIVVTRIENYPAPGAVIAHSLPEALSLAKDAEGSEEIFVIGGGELYRAALPFADRLCLTLVDLETEADTFFPAYEDDFKTIVSEHSFDGPPPHRLVILER